MKSPICCLHRPSFILSAFVLPVLITLSLSAPARPLLSGATSIEPDYFSLLKNRVTWNRLPVGVYFVRDSEYTVAREKATCAGFDLWEQATAGFVCYQVQESPKRAQITVRFEPQTDDGHTTTSFTSRRILSAQIVIGVERGEACDLECTAAHEFGHALGLSGHSEIGQDLMYPAHIMGRSWSITRRDLNTLARAYHIDWATAAEWTPQRVFPSR